MVKICLYLHWQRYPTSLLHHLLIKDLHQRCCQAFHRTIEWFEMERTLRGHLAQLPYSEQGAPLAPSGAQSPYSLGLSVSSDGAGTTSLCSVFQCLTSLILKNLFLISYPKPALFPFEAIFPLFDHNRPLFCPKQSLTTSPFHCP